VILVPDGETVTIEVKTITRLPALDLEFEVLNAVYAPGKVLKLKKKIPIKRS
jgi:hypothetical protein